MFSAIFLAFTAQLLIVASTPIDNPYNTYGVPKPYGNPAPKALYFQTNSPGGNAVVAVSLDANGAIGSSEGFPTGGRGSQGINATGQPVAPDSLFSQSAVISRDGYVFAVNAGSNTLSLFKHYPNRPNKLKLIGKENTLGEFPLAVAYSSKLKQACVLNSGRVNGISCFGVSPYGLSCLDSYLRPLGLNQTTPPSGPPFTGSDILFTRDSSALVATVKGNAMTNQPGFVATYAVEGDRISMQGERSSPNGVPMPFGASFASNDKLYISDPSLGAAAYDVKTKAVTPIPMPGQKAACWTAYSRETKGIYVFDGGRAVITEVDTETDSISKALNLTSITMGGLLDATVVGDKIYAIQPRNGSVAITAADLSGGKGTIREIGTMEVTGIQGVGVTAMGLASSA